MPLPLIVDKYLLTLLIVTVHRGTCISNEEEIASAFGWHAQHCAASCLFLSPEPLASIPEK